MGVLTRRQRGMSLVEVLVALAILAIVTLSVIGLFTQSIAMNATGMDYTTVNNIARSTLEDLVSLPFNDPRISIDPTTWDTTMSNIRSGTITLSPNEPYTVTFQVAELRLEKSQDATTWQEQLTTPVNPGQGNVKQITVVVSSQRGLLLGRREVKVVGMVANGLF
jgi:prepilin-type N-terminal cleavage/methylation domain-containing protein